MTFSIIACARNEGPFLVEWLAHHLSIGFDKIFIATNDCEDGTDEILDRLADHWPIYRIENSTPIHGLSFQRSAVRKCLDHPEMQDQEWVLHIDLDEFLNIHTPSPQVGEFLMEFWENDAVMLSWKIFGSNGQKNWVGGSVLDSFITCQDDLENSAHKSFFRRSVFRDAAPHCPKQPMKPVDQVKVVNTRNEHLDALKTDKVRWTCLDHGIEQRTWHGACINHYMHKSSDLTEVYPPLARRC